MANPNSLTFLREDFLVDRVALQRTTFTIDALGRFLCNTWTETTGAILDPDLLAASGAFDAVVIGGGTYGAYCAEKIWRRGGKVLVLDAGDFLVSEHTQNLTDMGLVAPGAVLPGSPASRITRNVVWGTSWTGNQITPGQAYCVGGKSLFWGGWCPRMTDDVLQDFPTGARDYLKKNYQAMEVQLGVKERERGNPDVNAADVSTDFIDDQAPDNLTFILRKRIDAKVSGIKINGQQVLAASQPAPLAVQGQSPSSGLFSFDKFSSVPILTAALREDIARSNGDDANRRLFLIPKCHVRRLNTTGATVDRIDVLIDDAFQSLPVPPTTRVILALGCIESTRLALESFPTPLMGRNLMPHLRSNVLIRIPRNKFPGLRTGEVETAATFVQGRTTKGGRFHFQITASANPDHNAEAVLFRTIPDTDVLNSILEHQNANDITVQIRGIGEPFGVKDLDPHDQAGSAIFLSDEIDPLVQTRRAHVHMVPNPLDVELWKEMDDAIFALAEALGEGQTMFQFKGQWVNTYPPESKYKLNVEPEAGPRDGMGTTFHESGTLWMGEDPFPSPTDSTGRFRHINNAYCADSSVFTRVGSANPVLTGCTLVRQLADVVAPQPVHGFTPEPGFRSLFQFKGTDPLPIDWEDTGRGFHRWKEIMETQGNGIGFLVYTREQFKNFILRLQWRSFTIRNNSGVYVRLPRRNGQFDIKTGYEIQIDNTGERPGEPFSVGSQEFFNPHHQTGAIYPVHQPPGAFPVPNGKPSLQPIPTKTLGEWNDYEIRVQDNRIKVVLNGVEVLQGGDYVDQNNTYPEGHVALQNHFKGARVQFRNVRIQTL
jgi:choline dehydrogenase-like flavoprotein